MKIILNYIQETRKEWFKIVWPDRKTVINSTWIILIFSSVSALFFFITDSLLNKIVGLVF